MCEEKGKTQSPARPKSSARGLKGRGVNRQRRGIILSVKTAALFLLMFSPALADITACREAFGKNDHATAFKECAPLAKAGIALAQFSLGYMYANGEGVPKDAVQAVSWYRKAAEQGDASAQADLGTMYDNGEGVPKDYVTAYMWRNLAAAQGDESGKKGRDALETLMTPAQIAEAQKLSREWKSKKP